MPDRLEITSAGRLPEFLSREEFFTGISIPRNKELMRIYRDLDIVESLGSGIPRILRAYGEDCFHFTDNFIRITFPASVQVDHTSGPKSRPESETESSQKSSQKSTQKSSQKIISLMSANSQITTQEIAEALGMSRRAITKQITNLREKGIIRRIGPNKGGHWEIVNNDVK